MLAPRNALRIIREAARQGNWRPDPHLLKQIVKRGLILTDVRQAILDATRIQPHDMLPLNVGGESWRVYGKDTEGRTLGVGIELVIDAKGNSVIVITAFVKEEAK